MPIKQKVVDRGYAASLKEMENLGHWRTKVGLPAGGTLGAPGKSKKDQAPASSMSQIIKIAAAHEFGATIKHPGGTAYRTFAVGGTVKAIFVSNKEAKPFDRRTAAHTIEIPERPFMRQTFDNNIAALQEFKKVRIIAVTRGKEDAETAIKKVGEFMLNKTKMTIREGNFAPLSAATIRAKGSTKPLIDTAQMINSLQHIEEYR